MAVLPLTILAVLRNFQVNHNSLGPVEWVADWAQMGFDADKAVFVLFYYMELAGVWRLVFK